MSLTFEIHLPEKTPEVHDVTHRYLEIEIQGSDEPEPESVEVPTSQLVVGPYFGDHGKMVKIQCWNINDSGNHSKEPAVLEAILKDPFHPPTPGPLAIAVTGKTHAPDMSYRLQSNEPLYVAAKDGPLRAVVTVENNAQPTA